VADSGVDPRRWTRARLLAQLYDWEHDRYLADVEVHLALAARFGGPVLELACGSGRLLAPVAQAGFRATGVDSSSAMLENGSRAPAMASSASSPRPRLGPLGVSADAIHRPLISRSRTSTQNSEQVRRSTITG